jgi:hypothetical protein
VTNGNGKTASQGQVKKNLERFFQDYFLLGVAYPLPLSVSGNYQLLSFG